MSDHLMKRPRAAIGDASNLRAYQLFFALHCAGLLVLKFAPPGEHGLKTILPLLAVQSGEPAPSWQLWTHAFLHVNPLEFAASAALLLFLGSHVERLLGSVRFVALYLGSAAASALLFEALSLLGGPPATYLGALAPGCAVLVAYVLADPCRRTLGVLPAPGFFVIVSTLVFAVAVYVEQEPARFTDENMKLPFTATFTADKWLDAQWEFASREAVAIPALTGFLSGAFVFALDLAVCHAVGRVRVRRQIRLLEEELDARERVDSLLEKISREGVGALSRRERKFLKYASSRFFVDKKRVLSE